jgi:general secretion pathway protein J
MKKSKQLGFTLIELMVALAIFAVIAVITATALHYVLKTKQRITANSNEFTQLQLAIATIQNDVHHIDPESIVGNDNELKFVVKYFEKPPLLVQYKFLNQALFRNEQLILKNIKLFKFNYVDSSNKFLIGWESQGINFPKAIQIKMDLVDRGKMAILIPLPV